MKESPIIFSQWKVKKMLGWDWTNSNMMTRRPINPQPEIEDIAHESHGIMTIVKHKDKDYCLGDFLIECSPFGQTDDLLWVRESHTYLSDFLMLSPAVVYRADRFEHWLHVGHPLRKHIKDGDKVYNHLNPDAWKWRPSIFLKKVFARLWLDVVDINIETLGMISTTDIYKEGVPVPTEEEWVRHMNDDFFPADPKCGHCEDRELENPTMKGIEPYCDPHHEIICGACHAIKKEAFKEIMTGPGDAKKKAGHDK